MVRKFDLVVVLVLLFIVVGAPTAFAQAGEHESGSDHEATHDFHPNLLALFIGVTDVGRGEAVALGIGYERRLNESFGIGVLAEHSFGDLDFWVYAVPFVYHPGQWKFIVAPGVEDGAHGSESLVRLGVEYGYRVGAWEISPQLVVDFVDGDQVTVLGVTFGKGF